MVVHLIKLSVGSTSIGDLKRWQATLLTRNKGTARDGLAHHVTRMMPRRAEELTEGGSIYWVIAGSIQARQRIVGVEEAATNKGKQCRLLLDPELIAVRPAARGPFQGWRYLEVKDAPPDLDESDGADDLPIRAELAELGLL
ncbi:MAG: DUF1489 domain-containing protein [Parvularcula sp.]|jgi:hypothetical protein|nr:DUF1489 domain-containing protein [Parvularcula sp.]